MPLEDTLGEPVDLSEQLESHRSTSKEYDRELRNAQEGRRQAMEAMAGVTPMLWECPLLFVPPQSTVTFESSPRAAFDWNGARACSGTDWPMADTPWLVLDRNGDGVIDSGAELFGTGVILDDGTRAQHGFEALAQLDEDRDGKLTSADAAWSSLMLWADADRDRLSQPHELRSLESYGLSELSLDFTRPFECDEAGNCSGERASVSGTGQPAGQLVDVYLRCR